MKSIEVKTILKFDRHGDNLVCYDIPTIQAVMGSTAVVGNYSYYRVTKTKNAYVVPIAEVKKRIAIVESRRDRLNDVITTMRKVVKGFKEDTNNERDK